MERAHFSRPLLVRHARPDDAAALHLACFPDEPYDRVGDYLRWCLAAPGRPVRLIALLDSTLVAHAEVMPRQNNGWAEVSSLVVAEGFRGLGIGQRLVGAAGRLAHRWGCTELRLQAAVRERHLLALYQRWGFEPRGIPLAGHQWLIQPLPAPDLSLPEVDTLRLEIRD